MRVKKHCKVAKCFTNADLAVSLKKSSNEEKRIDLAVNDIFSAAEGGNRIAKKVITWLRNVKHPKAMAVLRQIHVRQPSY